MLILGERRSLGDHQTCENLALSIVNSVMEAATAGECLSWATGDGDVELLDLFLEAFRPVWPKFSVSIIASACEFGEIGVLEWWLRRGLERKYDATAMHGACLYGRIDVLDWWQKSGLEMKHDERKRVSQGFLADGPRRDCAEEMKTWWKDRGVTITINRNVFC